MFKPERMKIISFLVLNREKDKTLELLQKLGVMHLVNLTDREEFSAFSTEHETEKLDQITSSLSRVNKILELFHSAEKKKSAIFKLRQLVQGGEQPLEISSKNLEKSLTHTLKILEKIEKPSLELDEKLKQGSDEENKIKEQLSLLEKIKDFSFDLSSLGDSEYLSVILGEIPKSNFDQLKKNLPKTSEILQKKEQKDEEIFILLLVSLKSEELHDILRENYFDFFELGEGKGTPLEAIKKHKARLSQINQERTKVLEEVTKISRKWKKELEVSLLTLENYKEREETVAKFVKTETTYLMQGFVPRSKLKSLLKLKSQDHCAIVEVKDPESEEKVPTLLKNPKVIKPFELITKLYGLPKYNEIDPTLLIFFVFPFFFGICLTDAGYGVILLLASLFAYWLYRNQDNAIKDFSYILIISAILTIILGIVTGGIFGPLTMGGKPIGNVFFNLMGDYELPILLDLFDRAKIALGLALGMGWLHLLFGFSLKAYSKYKEGNMKGALENLNWASLEFILGLGTLILLQYFIIPEIVLYLILGIFALNLMLMIILTGPLGIMDISGTFGNILSYARLFALAMATASIGLAINVMASEISKVTILGIGAILAPLFLIGGHLFSIIINTMGAVIHPLRLHYVEFFSKFYEGGGIAYSPFRFKQKRGYA